MPNRPVILADMDRRSIRQLGLSLGVAGLILAIVAGAAISILFLDWRQGQPLASVLIAISLAGVGVVLGLTGLACWLAARD
jgi:hypothetical protein